MIAEVSSGINQLDLINAKASETIYLRASQDANATLIVTDCMGNTIYNGSLDLKAGANEIIVPPSGLAALSF